jgi:hypothetical protein
VNDVQTFISRQLVPADSILIVNNDLYTIDSFKIPTYGNPTAFVVVPGDPGWEELRAAIDNPMLAVSARAEKNRSEYDLHVPFCTTLNCGIPCFPHTFVLH